MSYERSEKPSTLTAHAMQVVMHGAEDFSLALERTWKAVIKPQKCHFYRREKTSEPCIHVNTQPQLHSRHICLSVCFFATLIAMTMGFLPNKKLLTRYFPVLHFVNTKFLYAPALLAHRGKVKRHCYGKITPGKQWF
jgi:hypothetical protein